jgi:multicomponent Na+:H+ antiporter subunit C
VILAFALVAALLFGAGAYLLLQRDLIRAVAGIMLISQSAVVTLIGSGLFRGPAPIGVQPGEASADPLPQALALTALVIGLATVAFLLALVHRVVSVFRSDRREALTASETAHEDELARARAADAEEAA